MRLTCQTYIAWIASCPCSSHEIFRIYSVYMKFDISLTALKPNVGWIDIWLLSSTGIVENNIKLLDFMYTGQMGSLFFVLAYINKHIIKWCPSPLDIQLASWDPEEADSWSLCLLGWWWGYPLRGPNYIPGTWLALQPRYSLYIPGTWLALQPRYSLYIPGAWLALQPRYLWLHNYNSHDRLVTCQERN